MFRRIGRLNLKLIIAIGAIFIVFMTIDLVYSSKNVREATILEVERWSLLLAETVRVSLNTLMKEGRMDARFEMFETMHKEIPALEHGRVIRADRVNELFLKERETRQIPREEKGIANYRTKIAELTAKLKYTKDKYERRDIADEIEDAQAGIARSEKRIQDLRILTTDEREMPRSEMDHLVLSSGKPQFQVEGDIMRVWAPLVALPTCGSASGCHVNVQVGDVLGAVHMEFSTSKINDEMRKNVIIAGLIKMALGLAIIICLALMINIVVIKKIHIIYDALKKFSSGDLSGRIQVNGKDEVQDLAKGINGFIDRFCEMLEQVKQEKQSAQENENRLKVVIDNAGEGIITVDEKGVLRSFNVAAETIFGYVANDVIGRNVQELLTGLPLGQVGEWEIAGRRKGGMEFPLEVSVREALIQSMPQFICILRDITERKKTEADLLRAKEVAELSSSELSSYIKAIGQHAIISVGDLDGCILDVNEKFCEISGYTREELLGKNHRIVSSGTHPKDFFARFWAAISAGEIWRGEICNRTKSGALYWVDSAIVPVKDGQGHVIRYISVRIDITARKKTEAELLQAKLEAETANVAKGAFLANMSHEIRTPMNGVLGMLQLLQLSQLSPEQEGYVNTAYRSGEALLVLLNEVLDFSKMEAGRIELEAIDFDLRTLVEDVVALQASRGRDKGLTIACMIDAALPDRVCGDPTQLRQVLNNLLSNAIKFTEHGEVMVKAGFAEGSEHMLCFSVSDTGIGIPLAQQEAIFSPFTQADSSITRKFGGTGLGLALSRKLVEAMGGKLTLSSRVGEGSIFSFTVRVQAAAQEFMPWQPQRGLAGIYALIVDDNAASCSVLEHYLDHWGMAHDSVQEGQTALRQLHDSANAGRPYDIALLDQQMPGMDGIELARRIQADKKLAGVRMMLLSSGAQPGQAASAHAAGVQAYLPKPVRMHELHDALVRLLDVSPQEGQPLVTRHSLAEQQPYQSARVLVVEDNAVNQQVVVGMLRKLGIHADVAADGEQALNALEAHHYGLVFMDMMMPVLDGLETTRRLRATESSGKRTPVIAMTANNNEADRASCMAVGMDDCLYKPFQFEGLRTVLARWLNAESDHEAAPNDLQKNGRADYDANNFNLEILEQLREVLGQNYHKTIQTFMTDTEQRIAALRAAATSGDLESLIRQAHAIKGSSSNLGAEELAGLCSVLQQQSKSMVMDDILKAVEEVGQSFERAKRVLEAE